MLLELSESLPSLVAAKYRSAKASESLVFSPTEVAVIKTSTGIPFQLRYCPALAKKPEPHKEDDALKTKKPDPFENPSSDLLIAEIPSDKPSHVLVLNKYPVIAGHFIIATKSNKEQTHALEQDDLEATYACLKAWEQDKTIVDESKQKRLFAFFNSGDLSGASQPHRHLQFLPVEDMVQGEHAMANGWGLLIDLILGRTDGAAQPPNSADGFRLLVNSSLPFEHFACRLPSEPTGRDLLEAYQILYAIAKSEVDAYNWSAEPNAASALHDTSTGSQAISYNLAMTTEGMAIMPRRAEGDMLRRDDGTEVGFVALNGTTLGGSLMVKDQEAWDILREQPQKLDSILRAIGFPRVAQPLNN